MEEERLTMKKKKKSISKASSFIKQMMDVVMVIIKNNSLALKTKTTSIKTRLAVLGILRDKKSIIIPTATISHRIHALLGGSRHHHRSEEDEEDIADDDKSSSINVDSSTPVLPLPPPPPEWDYDDDDKYPDLRHSLFDIMDEEDCSGSVIDLVRNGMEKEVEEFVLEDEIDLVADVFIRRFHKQMRLQKQNSMKRYKNNINQTV
ncbi:hypothetical protein ZOSMA_36G00660 [Zostera marina]|uniref:Uncharacterized protein n=1 Tax=Zostera marina TaxID=29655 RepID=A0A0K9P615_ZOSMR|nr:hypothetical protein ZOSMA_36G00660 [Zostera marina]